MKQLMENHIETHVEHEMEAGGWGGNMYRDYTRLLDGLLGVQAAA